MSLPHPITLLASLSTILLALGLAGCSGAPEPDPDASTSNGGSPESPGPSDPGPADPGPADPGPTDTGPGDPGPGDPGPTDPGPGDPGPGDPGPIDPGPAILDAGIHTPFDRLLREHIADGVVDYAGLKRDERILEGYLATLASTDPSTLGRDDRLALWINAYNAYTIRLILSKYPGVRSILDDFEKPWDRKVHTVGGRDYSLNEIENSIVRPEFREPRIHFALNCAAKSCPPLASEAFVGDRLDEQLERGARAFAANRVHGVHVDRDGQRVELSKIFEWYGDDFDGGQVVSWLLAYVPAPDRVWIESNRNGYRVVYMDYDWSLNGR